MTRTQITVSLSKLVASRRNVRRVKPDREAHHKLVASIRAHGLLAPLVVKPSDDDKSRYVVIAGNRRLAALREIHREKDAAIPCILKAVDDQMADAMSLSENFAREAMHPLDEADAFAKLAGEKGKNAEAIAADFGVSASYVRQRMKLSTLDDVVKNAYRDGQIDTAIAEAFAAVPSERQVDIWQELSGQPRSAEQVRRIVDHGWIDSAHALFDVARLSENAVSKDLFSERVLIERHVFMAAQVEALEAQRQVLADEGWAEVVIGTRADVNDRLYATDKAPIAYDEEITGKLTKLAQKREKLDGQWQALASDDETGAEALQQKIDKLDEQAEEITKNAAVHYDETVKAVGTVFVLLDPDGQVRREYRIPRPGRSARSEALANGEKPKPEAPLTPDTLSERQLSSLLVHRTLAIRLAVLTNRLVQKRLLVLLLHENIRHQALALKRDRNAVTEAYSRTTPEDGKEQPATVPAIATGLGKRREQFDPFVREVGIDEQAAYNALLIFTEDQLDELIAILIADSLSASLVGPTPLIEQLAGELQVDQRQSWTPDAEWLGGYRKLQLAQLLAALVGPMQAHGAEQKKKSELVDQLAKLFADAAREPQSDPAIARRINGWLPAVLRPKEPEPEKTTGAEAA